MFSEVLDRFAHQSPTTVMFRATLENAVTPGLVDEVFAQNAKRQVCKQLLFSAVVNLLTLVASGIRKSVNDAYSAKREQFSVSLTSVYNKLQGVETDVSRQLVRQTALPMIEVVKHLRGRRKALLPGYRVKIIDGNHLAATEHRIKELRTIRSGPLPGLLLVVLEPDLMLATDVFPCEDAYTQERKLLVTVLDTVHAKDLWIADRNFCTTGFFFGIAARKGTFLIRQHKSTLHYELLGTRRKIGPCPTGMIYEQKVRLFDGEQSMVIRRVTIELKKPTRDGDTEIHLLTNLPAQAANARAVSELYLHRWTVENAFQELEHALHSEISTLGYPAAALLSFCVALLAYNAMSVVKTAMYAAHGEKARRQDLSGYYLTGELAASYHGMVIAVPAEEWDAQFGTKSPAALARLLRRLAAKADPDRFRKHRHGPTKPRPPRTSGKRHHHVSTARILATRKTKTLSVTA